MKFKNKVVAAVSATVITAGMVMSSVPAFAGSEEMDFINSYNGTAREVAQYVIGEGCTIEEATEIMDIYLKGEAELEGDNSGISTYAEGDTSTEELSEYYSSTTYAPTTHYILIISVDPTKYVERLNLYLEANTYKVCAPNEGECVGCFSYASSIPTIRTSLDYLNSSKWEYTISIPVVNETTITKADSLVMLPVVKGTGTSNELELYKSIDFEYSTLDGNGLFSFETFAMGDVNHDGEVTDADSALLLRYLIKLTDLSLEYKDGSNHYSRATNQIAADVDKNGKINLSDVQYINKFIGGSYEM